MVPTVVPTGSALTVAGSRARHRAPLKYKGQRSCALAGRDYESRARPLSYGGVAPKLAGAAVIWYSSLILRRGVELDLQTQGFDERRECRW